MKKIASLLVLILVVSCKSEDKKEENSEPRPLKTYSEGKISVNSYTFSALEHFLKKDNDTTYVVNFWATWCVPCVEELPNFEKLNATYKDKKVKVLLVSIDFPKMAESKLLPFIKEKNLKSDVVLLNDPDANSWINKVDSTWSGAIPATVIYKKDKHQFYEKSFTYEELETEVKKFL
ncbi:TlpA disulfide reductase family protein [Flavobacterium qiangtangense]|uniref:TlpA disulfide reductase family protein n=1 Tax=Flavobacterium qiangtangense TaxID=1442595 RepID=A0ABW1PL15_9FLAO